MSNNSKKISVVSKQYSQSKGNDTQSILNTINQLSVILQSIIKKITSIEPTIIKGKDPLYNFSSPPPIKFYETSLSKNQSFKQIKNKFSYIKKLLGDLKVHNFVQNNMILANKKLKQIKDITQKLTQLILQVYYQINGQIPSKTISSYKTSQQNCLTFLSSILELSNQILNKINQCQEQTSPSKKSEQSSKSLQSNGNSQASNTSQLDRNKMKIQIKSIRQTYFGKINAFISMIDDSLLKFQKYYTSLKSNNIDIERKSCFFIINHTLYKKLVIKITSEIKDQNNKILIQIEKGSYKLQNQINNLIQMLRENIKTTQQLYNYLIQQYDNKLYKHYQSVQHLDQLFQVQQKMLQPLQKNYQQIINKLFNYSEDKLKHQYQVKKQAKKQPWQFKQQVSSAKVVKPSSRINRSQQPSKSIQKQEKKIEKSTQLNNQFYKHQKAQISPEMTQAEQKAVFNKEQKKGKNIQIKSPKQYNQQPKQQELQVQPKVNPQSMQIKRRIHQAQQKINQPSISPKIQQQATSEISVTIQNSIRQNFQLYVTRLLKQNLTSSTHIKQITKHYHDKYQQISEKFYQMEQQKTKQIYKLKSKLKQYQNQNKYMNFYLHKINQLIIQTKPEPKPTTAQHNKRQPSNSKQPITPKLTQQQCKQILNFFMQQISSFQVTKVVYQQQLNQSKNLDQFCCSFMFPIQFLNKCSSMDDFEKKYKEIKHKTLKDDKGYQAKINQHLKQFLDSVLKWKDKKIRGQTQLIVQKLNEEHARIIKELKEENGKNVKQLERELEVEKFKNSRMINENAKINKSLQQQESQTISKLKKQITKYKLTIQQLNRKQTDLQVSLKNKINQLTTKLQKSQQKIKQKDKIIKYQEQIQTLKFQAQQLQDKILSLNQEIDLLKEQNKSLKQNLQKQKNLCKSLQAQLNQQKIQQTKHNNLYEQKITSTNKQKQLQRQIQEKNQIVNRLQEQIKQSRQKYSFKQQQYRQSYQKFKQQNNRNQQLEMDIQQLKRKSNTLEESQKNISTEIKKLEQKNQELNHFIMKIAHALKQLTGQKQDVQGPDEIIQIINSLKKKANNNTKIGMKLITSTILNGLDVERSAIVRKIQQFTNKNIYRTDVIYKMEANIKSMAFVMPRQGKSFAFALIFKTKRGKIFGSFSLDLFQKTFIFSVSFQPNEERFQRKYQNQKQIKFYMPKTQESKVNSIEYSGRSLVYGNSQLQLSVTDTTKISGNSTPMGEIYFQNIDWKMVLNEKDQFDVPLAQCQLHRVEFQK